MAWTTTPTWATGRLVTVDDLEDNVFDNLNYVHAGRVSGRTNTNEASDYTTTSATFVDIDSTDLSKTLTPTTSKVRVYFHGSFQTSASGKIYLDVAKDGVRQGGDDGYGYTIGDQTLTLDVEIDVTPNVSTTIKLQWKQTGTITATLYAGAGTSDKDVHPQFRVEESANA